MKTHKNYTFAPPDVQRKCDELVAAFVAEGKLAHVPDSAADEYPWVTTTTYYPIQKPWIRPIFPCIQINQLLKRFGKLRFRQIKLEHLYYMFRSVPHIVCLDLQDAFMHLATGQVLQKLLTIRIPNTNKRFYACRCIYGLFLSLAVLEVAVQYLLTRHCTGLLRHGVNPVEPPTQPVHTETAVGSRLRVLHLARTSPAIT